MKDQSFPYDQDLKRCRFLYLVGQLGRGGTERQLSYLLQAMDRERYEPAVLVWNVAAGDVYVDEIKSLGVPIYSFPREASRLVKLRGIRQLVRWLTPEVIHSYSFYTNFAAYWAAHETRGVAIGSLRGDFAKAKKDSGSLIGRLGARWPRYQISNSFASARSAKRAMSIFSPKHVKVVRNALDLGRFYCADWKPSDRPLIVGVGSLLSLKRWDRLLRVVRRVSDAAGDFRVLIAGDGPERGVLERHARDLGIAETVRFLGATSDVPALLRESRFLAHTSDTEGCPNSVMEAMACGRAVVAMEAGDISTLVEDGRTGFVIRRGDEEAFAQRVLELLTDDNLCRRMGMAARAKAEREFGLGRLVSETMSSYKAAGWKG